MEATVTQLERKECTMCKIKKDNTTEFFYKGKNILRAKCKKCCSKEVMNNPKHNLRNIQLYYKNQEKRQQYAMVHYIKQKTGVALAC